MPKISVKEMASMLDIDTRVTYCGSLGTYAGTVVKDDSPAVTVNLDGIGLVLVAEDELEPIDEQDRTVEDGEELRSLGGDMKKPAGPGDGTPDTAGENS